MYKLNLWKKRKWQARPSGLAKCKFTVRINKLMIISNRRRRYNLSGNGQTEDIQVSRFMIINLTCFKLIQTQNFQVFNLVQSQYDKGRPPPEMWLNKITYLIQILTNPLMVLKWRRASDQILLTQIGSTLQKLDRIMGVRAMKLSIC